MEAILQELNRYKYGLYSILETYIHEVGYGEKELVTDLDKLLNGKYWEEITNEK